MAVFHHLFSHLYRGGHTCAVATAAYRSGECLTLKTHHTLDGTRQSFTFDYSKKAGISFRHIFYPKSAPQDPDVAPWRASRQALWQHVEDLSEGPFDLLAIESVFALPEELSPQEHETLITSLIQETYAPLGLMCDVNIHSEHKNNPHVHIMCPAWVSGTVGGQPQDFVQPLTKEETAGFEAVFAQAFCDVSNRALEAKQMPARLSPTPGPVYSYEALRPWL